MKSIRLVKSWVLACWWWQFDWSFAHLIAPVVSRPPSIPSLAPIKSRMKTFWYQVTQVHLEKRPLKWRERTYASTQTQCRVYSFGKLGSCFIFEIILLAIIMFVPGTNVHYKHTVIQSKLFLKITNFQTVWKMLTSLWSPVSKYVTSLLSPVNDE